MLWLIEQSLGCYVPPSSHVTAATSDTSVADPSLSVTEWTGTGVSFSEVAQLAASVSSLSDRCHVSYETARQEEEYRIASDREREAMSTVQPYQRSSRKSEAEMNIFFSLGQEQAGGLSKETAEVNPHGLPTRKKPFPKDMSYGAGHPDSMSGVLSPTSTIRDAERRLFVLDRAAEEPDERLEMVLAGILDFDDVFD